MRSGLERTSGEGYSRWIGSRDWVGAALGRPLLYQPGTQMLYSTGNTHLLSAILTKATRQSTLRYAQQKLARPLGIRLDPWRRDPQGIYLGGNQMRLSPRALLRFGELYRNGGRYEGRQIVPAAWVEASTQARTRSPFSGQPYGYGWFVSELRGHRLFYAWGHGGQFIFVVPDLELTVVTTSDPSGPRDFEHLGGIYKGVLERMIALFERDGFRLSRTHFITRGPMKIETAPRSSRRRHRLQLRAHAKPGRRAGGAERARRALHGRPQRGVERGLAHQSARQGLRALRDRP